MLIGQIRLHETRTIDAESDSLAGLRDAVAAQVPAGWEITDMPASMPKGTQQVRTTATIARRDQIEELEADNMASLEAKVPGGWQLLTVRTI